GEDSGRYPEGHPVRGHEGRDRGGPGAVQVPGHPGDLLPESVRAGAGRRHAQIQGAPQIQDLVKPGEPRPERGTESGTTGQRLVVGPEAAGKRLDVALAAALGGGVSRTQIARQIAEGAVTVNGVRASAPSQKVRAGDRLTWEPPPVRPVAIAAEAITLQVVHEDRWL